MKLKFNRKDVEVCEFDQIELSKYKAYRDVLKHRKTCPKWGTGFCLDCFGGGLTTFTKRLEREQYEES